MSSALPGLFGSSAIDQTGMSGRLPLMFVQLVPALIVFHTCGPPVRSLKFAATINAIRADDQPRGCARIHHQRWIEIRIIRCVDAGGLVRPVCATIRRSLNE